MKKTIVVLVCIASVLLAKNPVSKRIFYVSDSHPISTELVSELSRAKTSGDVERINSIQSRLDRLAHIPTPISLECNSVVSPLPEIPPRADKSFDTDGYIASSSNFEGSPAIAVSSDGTIFAAYIASLDTVPHKFIAVVKSTDGGLSWTPLISVTDPSYDLDYPQLAIGEGEQNWVFLSCNTSANDVQVARFSFTGAGGEIHSVDGSALAGKRRAKIITDTDYYYYVYVAYICSGMFDTDVHLARSTDFGVSWTQVDFTNQGTEYCDIAYLGGGKLCVVTQTNSGETGSIWSATSSDYGSSWSSGSNIVSSGAYPRIAAYGDDVMVTYTYKYSDSDHDIQYVHSTDGGSTWENGSVTYSFLDEKFADISAGENSFMLAYWKQGKIEFASCPFGGYWGSEVDVSDEATAAETFPAISVSNEAPGGCPVIAWENVFTSSDHDVKFDKNCCEELTANLYAFPVSGTAPMNVTFKNQSTGLVENFIIYFGDGESSTEDSVVHTYTEPGTYEAMLVASNFCITETSSVEITVDCPELTANISVSTVSGNAPLTVSFSDSSQGIVSSRVWDFGDGFTDTSSAVEHTYNTAGTYNVSLIVTDVCGSVDTAYVTIWVYAPLGAQITISPAILEFGEISVGGCGPQYLAVGNVGDADLIIDSVKIADANYSASISAPMTISPAGWDTIEVQFCPTDTGRIDAVMAIFSNDPHTPIKSAPLTGTGVETPASDLSLTPTNLEFDSVAFDDCQSKRITVRNNGTSPIRVNSMTLVGSGAFSITGSDTFTVDPDSWRYITIRFCPNSSASSYVGTLFVQTDVGEYTIPLSGTAWSEMTCIDYGSYQICSDHIDGDRIYGNIRLVNDLGDTIAMISSVGDVGAYIDLDVEAGTGVARFVHEDGSKPYVYGGAFDLTYWGIKFRFDPSTDMLPDSIRDKITPDSLLGAPFSYSISLDPAEIDVDEGYWDISGEIAINNGPNFMGSAGVHRRSHYDGSVEYFIDDFELGLWDNAFKFKFRDLYVVDDTIEARQIYLKVNSSLIPSTTFIDGGYFEINARSLAIYHGELINLDMRITFPDFVFPAGGHTVGIRRAKLQLVWEDGEISRFSGGGRLSISGLMPDLGGDTYIGAYVTIIRDDGLDDVRLEFMGWSPGVPLGATGFFLTGVEGEIDHITEPSEIYIEFGCQLSGGPSVPYFGSVVRMEPTVSIDFGDDVFALNGDVRFLEHLARGSAEFRYWWNYGGGGWALDGYANLRTGINDYIWARGGTELSMWREPVGRFHLTGNSGVEVHIQHHAIAWLFPTHDVEVDGTLYYGEFRHGGDSGGHWGVKGEAYLNFFGLHPSIAYIDGHTSLLGDAESYEPMEMYRTFYKNATVDEDIRYELGSTDMNLFTIRTASDVRPNISIETPDGDIITLDSCSFDDDAPLVRTEGYYDGHFYRGIMVKRNIPGVWTVHLSGLPAGDTDHPVQVKGFHNPMSLALSTELQPDGFDISGTVDGVNPEDTVYMTIMLKPDGSDAGGRPIAEMMLTGDFTIDTTFTFDQLGFVEGDYTLMAYAEDNIDRFADFVDSTTTIHFPTDVVPPSAPSFAIASWVDDENIRLTWQRVSEPDVAGYKVYKGWNDGGDIDWWETNDVANANYFLFDNAKVMLADSLRESFVFGISAYDNAGNESDIYIVSPTGLDPATRDTIPPVVNFDYTVPNLAERIMTIYWNGDDDIYSYILTISNTDGDVFLQTQLPGDQTEYTAEKLIPGADYMLTIVAIDSSLNLSVPDTIISAFYDVADQDDDGIPDWWENFYFDSPESCDPSNDPDGDLVDNRNEYLAGTDPNNSDTDNDGVPDLSEIASPIFDPNSDADNDGDRIPDDWENYFFGSDTIRGLANRDDDGDGLNNLAEYENRTDPHNPDSDGGGISDGDEVALGTDPNDPSDDDDVVCTISLHRGWNLISLPVIPETNLWQNLFPSGIALFEYDNELGAYNIVDSLEQGVGYWLYSVADVDVDISGVPVFHIEGDFTYGWLLVGSPMIPTGYPLGSIHTDPAGLIVPPAFEYDGGTGYATAPLLQPGKGYWIFVGGDGEFTMDRNYVGFMRDFASGDIEAGTPPPPPSLDGNSLLPESFAMKVYPTPFNSSTNISFEITENTYATIDVLDLSGHILRHLFDGETESGIYSTVWDGKDDSGENLSAGLYLIRLKTSNGTITKKALLVR